MTAREVLSEHVSEADWQGFVVTAAAWYGWLVFHPFDSRRSTAGFPDLVLVHRDRGELIFAELKTAKGKVTAAQQSWLDALTAAGAETHVWRPADQDAVMDRLKGTGR